MLPRPRPTKHAATGPRAAPGGPLSRPRVPRRMMGRRLGASRKSGSEPAFFFFGDHRGPWKGPKGAVSHVWLARSRWQIPGCRSRSPKQAASPYGRPQSVASMAPSFAFVPRVGVMRARACFGCLRVRVCVCGGVMLYGTTVEERPTRCLGRRRAARMAKCAERAVCGLRVIFACRSR